jgi:virginiamycin B lyase
MKRRAGALCFTGVFLSCVTLARAQFPPAITEFPIPTSGAAPHNVTAGPDGAVWFTEFNTNQIGRVASGNIIAEYPIPTASSFPNGIAAGPDGALWFTELFANKIGRITTTGTITEFAIPTASASPFNITAGPDGALWFTEFSATKIGRITTSGVVTEYPVLSVSSVPSAIAAGPDGALWFTETGANKIGRITTAGSVSEYPVPTSSSAPSGIAAGPDGALWFTETAGNNIGRITTAGNITEYPIPTASASPSGITLAQDGALWFTETSGNNIGRITAAGVIAEAAIPSALSSPLGIAPAHGETIWFTEDDANNIAQIALPITQPPLQLQTVTPCRVIDTRRSTGPLGGPSIAGGTSRTIPVPSSSCGVPPNAAAYSVNITVVPKTGTLGYLTVWPAGQPQPVVSTLNSLTGAIRANAAIVPAGAAGAISAFATDTTDVIVDINGYFVPPAGATLQFYPLPPCRVLDTRNPDGPLGGPSLAAAQSRSFPISGVCGVPAGSLAYSFNVTVAPEGDLGYLTVWPAGSGQPVVSTLNSPAGEVLANAAIVPAGSGGAVNFFATDATNLVVDINGYFAAPGSSGLNFFAVTPCRVVDTRNLAGPFGGPSVLGGTARSFALSFGSCDLPAFPTQQAYSLNMTVVPQGPLGYLTTWPTGLNEPFVSTLNSPDGQVVANAAIVPSGATGSINAFATNTTDVIVDTNGYFGP